MPVASGLKHLFDVAAKGDQYELAEGLRSLCVAADPHDAEDEKKEEGEKKEDKEDEAEPAKKDKLSLSLEA